MSAFPILNALCGAAAALVIAYRLGWHSEILTLAERIGLGILGGAMILTLGPILFVGPTPFDDWGGGLLRVGTVVFVIGQLRRHADVNATMVRHGRRWKKNKERDG